MPLGGGIFYLSIQDVEVDIWSFLVLTFPPLYFSAGPGPLQPSEGAGARTLGPGSSELSTPVNAFSPLGGHH